VGGRRIELGLGDDRSGSALVARARALDLPRLLERVATLLRPGGDRLRARGGKRKRKRKTEGRSGTISLLHLTEDCAGGRLVTMEENGLEPSSSTHLTTAHGALRTS